MESKIAILLTTFIRDDLLFRTLDTIVEFFPKDAILLIADQGHATEQKLIKIARIKEKIPCEYYQLEYDCGLSFARNYLVEKAQMLNCQYCLLTADSIQFTKKYDFEPIINFLDSDSTYGLVGLELFNSKCYWEYYLDLTSEGIHLIPSHDFITINNIVYKKCEIVRNIFLAKTITLLNLWNVEFKLCEHELAFLEYKQRGYKVFWTDLIIFYKVSDTSNNEYNAYRNRFIDYQKLLRQKLNINSWVIYEK